MREKSLSISGREVHFLSEGQPTDRALVILHGWAREAVAYKPVVEQLNKDDYRIVPDLPGFGKSDTWPSSSFDQMAEVVGTLLAKLDVERTTLVGHSLGGPVALKLACRYPKFVQQIFLFGSAGINPRRPWYRWIKVDMQLMRYNKQAGLKEDSFAGLLRAAYRTVRHPLWHWNTFRATTQYDAASDASQIVKHGIPVEVVWGRDENFFPDTFGLARLFGVTPRYVHQAGHDLILTHPKEAAEIINQRLVRQAS